MGCNCNNPDSIPLSMKKENRRKLKEKINDIKKLWKESAKVEKSGTATASKEELGFK